MVLRTPDASALQLNPRDQFGHRDFGGRWQWLNHDLGADAVTGLAINNKWENKGQFRSVVQVSWPHARHVEFMEVFFHLGEQYCIPQIVHLLGGSWLPGSGLHQHAPDVRRRFAAWQLRAWCSDWPAGRQSALSAAGSSCRSRYLIGCRQSPRAVVRAGISSTASDG